MCFLEYEYFVVSIFFFFFFFFRMFAILEL